MEIRGSIAHEAFATARSVISDAGRSLARTRPAIDFVVPLGPRVAMFPALGEATLGPIHAAAAGLRGGACSARDLVDDALTAVARRDPELGAVVQLMATEAIAEATARDRDAAAGVWRGPLHGVPVTVKDVIDVAGVPTRAGSDAYFDVPRRDASSVARLRAAGAVVIAKVSTHEFALGVTSPQSRNPHDATRIPGGSSGGSAIAVSTGMGLASLGTDTRASIRVPAALSGVVGFKPTYGRVPVDGVVTLSWTMDHVAPMAATVGDAALLLEVLRDAGGLVPAAAAPMDRLRVGVPRAAFDDADPRVTALVEAGIAALERAGALVEPAPVPSVDDFAIANAAGLVISRCEAAAYHRSLGLDRARYWQEVREQLDEADSALALDYIDAQRLRAELAVRLATIFDHVDVLAMPTSPVLAPPVDDFAQYLMLLARNAIPWSLVGFPAISVPVGSVDGLPVGMQFVAGPDHESRLVSVARVIELEMSGHGANGATGSARHRIVIEGETP